MERTSEWPGAGKAAGAGVTSEYASQNQHWERIPFSSSEKGDTACSTGGAQPGAHMHDTEATLFHLIIFNLADGISLFLHQQVHEVKNHITCSVIWCDA